MRALLSVAPVSFFMSLTPLYVRSASFTLRGCRR